MKTGFLSHSRALEFFGGVPQQVVPDNLKSGVSKAHRYEPDLNPSYAEWAAHYGAAVVPARARRPRDKAKVESAVLVVERWILARLRHATFFSLDELNQAIAKLLTDLNQRLFKKLPGSRQQWFDELERPALQPLPAERYVFARWKKARVNIDYHIDIERHYYSVPYQLARQEVEARITAHTVEIYYRGQAGSRPPAQPISPGAIPPSPNTCPKRTASMPIGVHSGCSTGPRKADPRRVS